MARRSNFALLPCSALGVILLAVSCGGSTQDAGGTGGTPGDGGMVDGVGGSDGDGVGGSDGDGVGGSDGDGVGGSDGAGAQTSSGGRSAGGAGGQGGDSGDCTDGDTMPAGDGCNTCHCNDGRWGCTLIGCGEPGAVCGGFAGFTCPENEYCAYQEGQNCGAGDVSATCAPIRPGGCNFIYEPVCGCDGVTYSNSCLAQTAGQGILSSGECD